MSFQNQPPTPLPSEPKVQSNPGDPSFARVRGWLRTRTGRVVIPSITLLLGIVIGISALFLFGEMSVGPIIVVPVSSRGDIIVEADRTFVTQLVTKNLASSAMPGQIQHINVNLIQGSQMVVSGEDDLSVMGLQLNRPFHFTVQLYVSSCVLQIHIVQADFSNLPVTHFAQSFESQVNQQLQQKPEGLPSGFQYCATEVRTVPDGMFVTYTATPI